MSWWERLVRHVDDMLLGMGDARLGVVVRERLEDL